MQNEIPSQSQLMIQYIIVGIIILGALTWVVIRLIKKARNKDNPCCGCSLGETCGKKELKSKFNSHENHKNLE